MEVNDPELVEEILCFANSVAKNRKIKLCTIFSKICFERTRRSIKNFIEAKEELTIAFANQEQKQGR